MMPTKEEKKITALRQIHFLEFDSLYIQEIHSRCCSFKHNIICFSSEATSWAACNREGVVLLRQPPSLFLSLLQFPSYWRWTHGAPAPLCITSAELHWRTGRRQLLPHGSNFCQRLTVWSFAIAYGGLFLKFCCDNSWELNSLGKLVLKGRDWSRHLTRQMYSVFLSAWLQSQSSKEWIYMIYWHREQVLFPNNYICSSLSKPIILPHFFFFMYM